MLEMLRVAITGIHIIPTTFLVLSLLYWLTVMIGALDIDVLDIDLDGAESGGFSGSFQGLLSFLNVSELPLMLVLSVFSVVFWFISMATHLLPFQTEGWIGAVLLLPNFLVSILMTKALTQPLKALFKSSLKGRDEIHTLEGELCTLLCDLSWERLGQAEIVKETVSFVINVKLAENIQLLKGEKALVIQKDLEKDFYIINKFEEVL